MVAPVDPKMKGRFLVALGVCAPILALIIGLGHALWVMRPPLEFVDPPKRNGQRQVRDICLFLKWHLSDESARDLFRKPQISMEDLEATVARELSMARGEPGGEELFWIHIRNARELVREGKDGRLQLIDEWGNRLRSRSVRTGGEIRLWVWSLGPDGKDESGGGDNICGTASIREPRAGEPQGTASRPSGSK